MVGEPYSCYLTFLSSEVEAKSSVTAVNSLYALAIGGYTVLVYLLPSFWV